MPQISNVTVRPTLTNLSLGYTNQRFIAPDIYPIVPRDTREGEFFGSGREMFVRESDIRGIRDRANAVDHDYRRFTYRATEHSLLEEIPAHLLRAAQVSGVASVLNIERDAQNIVDQKLALGREVDFAAKLRDTTSYASGQSETLAGTAQFSDYVNSDPIGKWDFAWEKIRSGVGAPPNLAIIPRPVFKALRRHPKMRAEISQEEGRLTLDQIKDILEVDRILVPDVVENVAPRNVAEGFTPQDVWGKDIILLKVADRIGLSQLSHGYLFRIRYPGSNLLAESRSWDEEDRRLHVIEGNYMEDRKVGAVPEAGYLMKNAIA